MPSCIWNTWLPGVTLLMRIVPVAGSRTCRNTGFRAGPPERPQIWLELTQKLPPLPNVVLVEGAAEVPTRIFGRLRTLKNSDEKTSLRRSPNLNDFCTQIDIEDPAIRKEVPLVFDTGYQQWPFVGYG